MLHESKDWNEQGQTPRKWKHCSGLHEITVEERRWMRWTTFNILTPTERRRYNRWSSRNVCHCDRIIDKTLPILFSMENVCSYSEGGFAVWNPYAYVHRFSWRPTYAILKGCYPCNTATHRFWKVDTELSGHNGHPCNFWRSCPDFSNNNAASSKSSSSLVKHRYQKRPTLLFASSCYEK